MSGDAAITTITKTTVATTTTTTTRTTTTNTDDFYANATSKCCCCFTFLLLLLLLSSGVWGPARPLLLQQNNKCGSATRAVACPCPCSVCVWRNENWIRLLPPSSLSPLFLCSSSAVRFSLVWLVYCGRLAGGVGQAGDTMEPLSLSPSLSLSCTQIMAFAKLDPGSFSGFLLLLLLLSASLVWARDHVDYNYIRKVAIQIRWNSIRRISWLAPFESERSSQLI